MGGSSSYPGDPADDGEHHPLAMPLQLSPLPHVPTPSSADRVENPPEYAMSDFNPWNNFCVSGNGLSSCSKAICERLPFTLRL